MKAHFFDLDVLIRLDNKIWIVDKSNPNIPIMRLSQSDFKLIKSGIYKNQGNKVEYNGNTFWLPDTIFNQLKIKLKVKEKSLGNIGISLQEFLNKELIDNLDVQFNMDVISSLKNSTDDIYVVCSRQTKKNYESLIEKFEKKLFDEGLKVKRFYFILDTFFNQKSDDVKFKKTRLLLENLTGYKTDTTKFIDEEVDKYDNVYFYDNEFDTLKIADECNQILKSLLSKTSDGLRDVIKEDITEFKPALVVNQITDNLINRNLEKKITLDFSNVFRTFESFNLSRKE
jgi:hypothetical protein